MGATAAYLGPLSQIYTITGIGHWYLSLVYVVACTAIRALRRSAKRIFKRFTCTLEDCSTQPSASLRLTFVFKFFKFIHSESYHVLPSLGNSLAFVRNSSIDNHCRGFFAISWPCNRPDLLYGVSDSDTSLINRQASRSSPARSNVSLHLQFSLNMVL